MSKIHYDTPDLRAFCELARQGGFTRAADALAITPSALSRRIAKLEDAMGGLLVERSTRSMQLTSLGRHLLQRVQPLLDAMDDSVQETARLAAGQEGRIAIGCIATIAYAHFPEAVDDFRQAYPDVRVSVRDGSSTQVTAAVLNHEVEFGVVATVESSRDLILEEVVSDPFVFICDKNHELAGLAEIPWSALHNQRLVGFEASSWSRQLMDKATRAQNIDINWFYETESLASLVGFLKSGRFATPITKLFASFAREMVTIPLVDPVVERQIFFIRRRDAKLSPPVELLRNALGRRLKAAVV